MVKIISEEEAAKLEAEWELLHAEVLQQGIELEELFDACREGRFCRRCTDEPVVPRSFYEQSLREHGDRGPLCMRCADGKCLCSRCDHTGTSGRVTGRYRNFCDRVVETDGEFCNTCSEFIRPIPPPDER
ncbi:hypothetical protein [Candidatus Palauibacter sp.]|uniref:hypothetical protein n=1 Tax=Candidatus Palauibacter sp. TaxID=3101350 RepID=UPI003D1321B6